jgi:hypothetical protein
VIAAHRKVGALRVGIEAALDFSHSPPIDGCRISILFVASHHAALTADALRHVKMKSVLLPRLERAFGNSRRRNRRGDLVERLVSCR